MKTNIKIIVALIIGVALSTTLSYCLADTLIDSKNVYYKDNSELLADNVQDAIDGTCTKFESKIDNFLDKIYPVGSIYISTTLSTVDQVKEALGGTWAIYGAGRTLLSSSGKSEQTGGANTVTLKTENLPSHTHNYDKVSSTTGSTTLTVSQIPSHSHKYSKSDTTTGGTAITVDQMPSHTGHVNQSGGTNGWFLNSDIQTNAGSSYKPLGWTLSRGNELYPATVSYGGGKAHSHSITLTSTSSEATGGGSGHTHSISTGTATTTATGSGTSFNVQNAYITVYMYKRVS